MLGENCLRESICIVSVQSMVFWDGSIVNRFDAICCANNKNCGNDMVLRPTVESKFIRKHFCFEVAGIVTSYVWHPRSFRIHWPADWRACRWTQMILCLSKNHTPQTPVKGGVFEKPSQSVGHKAKKQKPVILSLWTTRCDDLWSTNRISSVQKKKRSLAPFTIGKWAFVRYTAWRLCLT